MLFKNKESEKAPLLANAENEALLVKVEAELLMILTQSTSSGARVDNAAAYKSFIEGCLLRDQIV